MNTTHSLRARRRRWPVAASFALAAASVALAGCGESTNADTATPDAGRDVPVVDTAPPTPIVKLSVDANRDGIVAVDGADYEHRADLTATQGASMLANLDDDDGDHIVDSEDEVVNGENDALDLARIRVAPMANLPAGAVGHILIDEAATPHARIFKHTGDAWELWIPAESVLTDAELRAGVEFGAESLQFQNSVWNGHMSLTLHVNAADGSMIGTDAVNLRTAPWVMANVLAPPIRVWGIEAAGYASIRVWARDLQLSTMTDNVELVLMNGLDPNYRRPREGPDVWMQDIMEFGWSSIPTPDGAHAQHYVIRTPNTTRPAGSYTQRELLGPDMGYIYPHATNAENGGRLHDPSLDSFGNLEFIPAYTNGSGHFPLGRVLHGWTASRHSDVALQDLLDTQNVQGPVLRVDTSFLLVGHIDELVSFVPATGTTRGWKMLVAAPALARTLMQGLVTRDAANGELLMFRGEYFYDINDDGTATPRRAERTINAILADPDLMAHNQMVQARITAIRQQIQTEVGLADDEIVEIPFLFFETENQRSVAMMPGTVNLLSYAHTVVVARPHSILINGADYFETDMVSRMMPLGLTTRFAEQWDVLHAADGEVHCGTNVLREIPNSHWWEMSQ